MRVRFLQAIYRSSPLSLGGIGRKIRLNLGRGQTFQEKSGGTPMKARILLGLLALAVVASSLAAHASVCSNSTIRGSYAFTIHGFIVLPSGSSLPIAGIAR